MGYIGAGPTRFNTADELTVTGNAEFNGNLTVKGTTTTIDSASVQTVDLGDNDKIRLGDGDDLQIYHDGSNSYIYEGGTGNLIIKATDIRIRTATDENYITATQDGALSLYYDNATKLATTSSGIDVTGTVVTDGFELNTLAIGGDTFGVVKSANNTAAGFDFFGDSTGTKGARVYYEGNGNLFTIAENTSGTIEPRLVIDDSGNVGIGTSGPKHKIHIAHSDTGAIPTDHDIGASASNTNFQGIHNESNSATYSGLALETRTSGASRWLIANEWQSTYLGDLVFRSRDSGTTSSEIMRLKSSGNVGIGTTSPAHNLHIYQNVSATESTFRVQNASATSGANAVLRLDASGNNLYVINYPDADASNANRTDFYSTAGGSYFTFSPAATEKMRLDSTGNLLVGKTAAGSTTAGVEAKNDGALYATRTLTTDTPIGIFNRLSTDGQLVSFRKDSTVVGTIGSNAGTYLYIGTTLSGYSPAILRFVPSSSPSVRPASSTGSNLDNVLDMGNGSARFDDVYATNGTIQTSDANEKQQIAALTDAEITAAKAISGLFKTFKWNSAVEAKGDAARTHAGVIAQDVEAAMTAAGLDAGDYAFFISSTWWETQTEVPAVEAVDEVLDEDGNVVTEAIEAKEAYTRTDTYDTAEEAPEGATQRNRKGIRYPELLAFIGAATEQRLSDIEARITALETA